MSHPIKPSASPLTLAERAWLRQELGIHFGAGPQIADGLFLLTAAIQVVVARHSKRWPVPSQASD